MSDGVHDAGCSLRVYRKEVVDQIDIYGEMHRMIPALLRWRGFRVTEMKVNHRAREYGVSKYDIIDAKFNLLQALVKANQTTTIADILPEIEAYQSVKFSRNLINQRIQSELEEMNFEPLTN